MAVNLLRHLTLLQGRNTAALRGKVFVICQGRKDLGLPQRQQHLGVVLGVSHDEILNLVGQRQPGCLVPFPSESRSRSNRYGQEASYLVSPEHGISFLALSLVPDLEQLLETNQSRLCSPQRWTGSPGPYRPLGKLDLTLMPHSLTRFACCLASGQSRAVPKALQRAGQYGAMRSTGRLPSAADFREPDGREGRYLQQTHPREVLLQALEACRLDGE